VVVPIYNVEDYLEPCLESIAGQTFGDLEVILVDDGSTDRSAEIAEEFAARDGRFRLVTQPNAGLGAARNTGIDAASGEFLAFVDSDDVLAPNAYELLLTSLDRTGSDFATGNVRRLTRFGDLRVPFLAKTFAEERPRTHVSRFVPLIADRTAWNKLWRRCFWDAHGLRFPEGVLNEDIPVVVPAQFAARSVDVIAEPVYYWRARREGDPSITQRRLEPQALRDRLTAIERTRDELRLHGPEDAIRWYDESVLAQDLRYHLSVLDRAGEDYRALFLDRANAFLDRADPRVPARLPAVERVKWRLVRRRRVRGLVAILRVQRALGWLRSRVARRIPVRHRRRLRGMMDAVGLSR
jgi:CDP-glycerol glycerophosphotransferase